MELDVGCARAGRDGREGLAEEEREKREGRDGVRGRIWRRLTGSEGRDEVVAAGGEAGEGRERGKGE